MNVSKKLKITTVCLCAILALCACGGGANTGAATTKAAAAETTAAATTAATTTKAAETTAAATEAEAKAGATAAGGSVKARGGDPISFTYMRPVWNPPTYEKGNAFEKILFEVGNVNIDVSIVPVADYDSIIPTRLAAGLEADIIWSGGPTNSALREAFNSGIFMPLNDLLGKYPAVKSVNTDAVWGMNTSSDGKNYFFPAPLAAYVPFPIYYRADIMEKHGLAVPKTIEEFTDLLRTIKELEPGMYPITTWELFSHWYFQNTAMVFGYNFNWVVDPDDSGRIIPADNTKFAADFYSWLNMLRKEDLMDPDFKVAQGKLGQDVFIANRAFSIAAHWAGYPTLLQQMRADNPDVKIGAISDLTGPNGRMGGQGMTGFDRGFSINAKTKKAEEIFTYLNWLYTDGYELCRFGVEGEQYNYVDGVAVGVPNEQRKPGFDEANREPLNFPIKAENTWPDWLAQWVSFQQMGLTMDDLDIMRNAFEDSCKNSYLTYAKPGAFSQTGSEKGSALYETTIKPAAEKMMIDPNANIQEYLDAVKEWLAGGGEDIIKEINADQGDWKPVKPEYRNTNPDYR